MNCCNANGKCTQGRDCPIRKQKLLQEIGDPYDETIGSVKGLIAFIAVTAALTLLAFFIWGK
jgi:hypothetical protein